MSDTFGPDPRDSRTWATRGWREATAQLRRIDGRLGTRRRAKLYGTISVEWRVWSAEEGSERRFDSCKLLDIPRSRATATRHVLLGRCQVDVPDSVTNGKGHLKVVVTTNLSIKKLRKKRDVRLGRDETTLNVTLDDGIVTQRVGADGKSYDIEVEVAEFD